MKLTRNFLLVITTHFIFPFSVLAQNDSILSLSLKEAQDFALNHFYVSRNAELDVKAASNRVWESTAIGLPQVSINGQYQRYLDDTLPSFAIPAGPDGELMDVSIFERDNYSLTANVSQLIFSGEYIVGLQAARIYKSLSEESFEKTGIDIRQAVAGTYFTILTLTENKKVLGKTLDNLRLILDQTRKIYEAGMMEDTDVDQIDLTLRRTENDMQSVSNLLETMHKMLKYQMGITTKDSIVLTENLNALVDVNTIDQSVYSFDLDNNIDYRILNTNEQLQHLLLKREKSSVLPNVSGFYTYNAVLNQTPFTPPQHLVGLTAGWNIFESGMKTAKIAQARIEYEKAQNMKEQEAERLILAAGQAQDNYITALTKYYNEEQNFLLSEKVMNKTAEKYREGLVSSLDLSLTNSQFLQAQISYTMAVQELLNSKISLDKAFNKL